ncbi:DUF6415 family natural product biosynthesis protein [Streptomyces sp. ISL-94]|uniref:DUF6415 family natural product biosynthesis protein n=1 Tax=Streptomyces sp. ISL-94 TaxID=2819190 RepID=UPI001BECAC3F|nr:DUF6415 family natural product biosynthesis protein [Streptomyces sp. ISL-94]MBT2479190.1 hypothetical protein [Streptomyces sp. ISL-94]
MTETPRARGQVASRPNERADNSAANASEAAHVLATAVEDRGSDLLAAFTVLRGPMHLVPDPTKLAQHTVTLLKHGHRLVEEVAALPEELLTVRARGGLRDWQDVLATGPAMDSAFPNWSYARALARVVETFVKALQREPEHGGREW